MPGYYENTGGLSALPRRTVLGGEEHLLSYITPEEAQMLREEGGGVTPTGGQYRGPGGLPAFAPSGATGSGSTSGGGNSGGGGGAGSGVFGGTPSNPAAAAQAAAAAAAAGNTVGHHGGITNVPVSYAPYGDQTAEDFSFSEEAVNVIKSDDAAKLHNLRELLMPEDKHQTKKKQYALAKKKAIDDGYVPNLRSKFNMAKAYGDNPGFFSPMAYSLNNKTLSQADIMGMPPSMFTGQTPFGVVGDPDSVFGYAVRGLAGLATSAIPAFAPFKSIYGLMSLMNDDIPSIDPVALAIDALGEIDVDVASIFGEDSAVTQAAEALDSGYQSIFGETGYLGTEGPVFGDVIGKKGLLGTEGPIASTIDSAVADVDKAVFTGDAIFGDDGTIANVLGDIGEIPGEVGDVVGEGLSSVADAIGLSDAFGFVGETADTVGKTIGDALSLPNIDLSLGDLGDIFSGTPSLATVGQQGGGPGIPQLQPSAPRILTPAQEKASTFKTYLPKPPRQQQDFTTAEDIFSRYIGSPEDIKEYPEGYSLADIQNRYISSPTIYAHSGGGIQNLVADQEKNYSIGNQDTIDTTGTAFSRKPFSATPHADLTNGSHSYISNVLNGHAFPQGMTNVQQMQKPMEAFPSGGQMNYNNTLHADYSRPQSFYAMPNMNKVG